MDTVKTLVLKIMFHCIFKENMINEYSRKLKSINLKACASTAHVILSMN